MVTLFARIRLELQNELYQNFSSFVLMQIVNFYFRRIELIFSIFVVAAILALPR